MKLSLLRNYLWVLSSEHAYLRFLNKGSAFILMVILVASLTFGLNVKPVAAQEIVDVISPAQVRVNGNFWAVASVHIEVDGPAGLNVMIQILEEETGDLLGEQTTAFMFPAGHHDGERGVGVELIAPGSPMIWELRAVLTGGNEWPFSVEVVGEETPPTISIVSLESEPNVPHVGEHVTLMGQVDYTIPEGSRFEIRYTTSHGFPTLFEPSAVAGMPSPWITIPEEEFADWDSVAPYRAGDDVGVIVPGSGLDVFQIPASAPLEPGDWVWYFRIVYVDPDGVEVEHGSRDLTVEVTARTDFWAVIDRHALYVGDAVPGELYPIEFQGRYFIPEGEVRDIEISVWDTDLGALVLDDPLREYNDVSGSGILLELFMPRAPMGAVDTLHIQVNLRVDGFLMDFVELEVDLLMGIIYSLEIEVVDSPPEIAYGSSLDTTVRVSWNFPPFPDPPTQIQIHIRQPGIFFPLASEFIEVHGIGTLPNIEINLPSEYVPPLDGDWNLEAVARAWPAGVYKRAVAPFTVNVIGAGDGVVGGDTDWMVAEGWPSMPTPFEGVELRFWAIIQREPVDPMPQQVWLTLDLDGSEILREAAVYLPDMDYYAFQSSAPWTATLGEHIAVWRVDPDGDYSDPDPGNNELLFRFTVEAAPPPFIPMEGEEPPPPEEEFDFYVTATPTERSLASSVSYSVNVELSAGEPEEVQLSLIDAPAGLSYAFNPSSGLPPYGSELTVTGSQGLRAAFYSMMIRASDGDKERFKPIILRVEEGADYKLSASPKIIRAEPGETVEYAISASSDSGYSQYVNLVVSGLPGGLTGRLGSSAGIPDFETTLYVEVGEDVSPRSYSVTVTGSGPEPKRVTVTLDVVEEVSEEPSEEEGSTLAYYLPLVYLIAIIAAIIAGAVLAIRRVRGGPEKAKAFCIECGKGIPVGTEVCPKCGTKQKVEE